MNKPYWEGIKWILQGMLFGVIAVLSFLGVLYIIEHLRG